MRSYRAMCSSLAGVAVALAVVGCSTLDPDAHMAAFSTQLKGANQVPPVATAAAGQLYVALDKNTLLLRWKLAFSGLSGPVTKAYFHGQAPIGANSNSTVSIDGPIKSPLEGRATLTAAQTTELLSGQWYVSLQTKAHPKGEIRGQMILRE
jgi:hypothetical protein